MKLCVVGKFPPIEGGVSTYTYWLAAGLARRGHDVFVVTTADEVDAPYRITLDAADAAWLAPRGRGSLSIISAQSYSRRGMGMIPEANPYVTKLAGLATSTIRTNSCEVVVGSYYEPYAFSAWLAATWCKRPVLVRHAGSDLGRLFRVPELAQAYSQMLRGAEAVMAHRSNWDRFRMLGAEPAQLIDDIPYYLPDIFNAHVIPLDVRSYATSIDGGPAPAESLDTSIPAIGVYGKVGRAKGTFDLIDALGLLKQRGVRFRLLGMIGAQSAVLRQSLLDRELDRNTAILPLLPNWKVPAFVRSCNLCCFLERGFSIASHDSVIPREILAAGSCLVISAQAASKQFNHRLFVDGENVVIINDPSDIGALAEQLRALLHSPASMASIGGVGSKLVGHEHHDQFLDRWEQTLIAIGQHRKPVQKEPRATALSWFQQQIQAHVPAAYPKELSEVPWPIEDAIQYLAAVREVMGSRSDITARRVVDACRFEQIRLECLRGLRNMAFEPFPVSDRHLDALDTFEMLAELRPIGSRFAAIAEFSFDMTPMARARAARNAKLFANWIEHAQERPSTYLLNALPNGLVAELKIDQNTRLLFERCNGSHTVHELARLFQSQTLDRNAKEQTSVALLRLHREGVIIFGERDESLRWSGGTRFPVR
jgi:glycosyltransferase involved in cell wall biosynthesis